MKLLPLVHVGMLPVPATWPRATLAERFRNWRQLGIKIERKRVGCYLVHPYLIITR